MSEVKSTQQERSEVLHRIWLAQAKKLAERLEATPAGDLEASLMNVARQFLSDNGINADTLKHADPGACPAREAAALLADLDLPAIMGDGWQEPHIK